MNEPCPEEYPIRKKIQSVLSPRSFPSPSPMPNLAGVLPALFVLFLLYQLAEFHGHITQISGDTRLQEAAAASWLCDPSEHPRAYGKVLSVDRIGFNDGSYTTCHDAARRSKQNVYLLSLKALVENSYLFKALTLESYVSQAVALVLVIFVIYSFCSYCKEKYRVDSLRAMNREHHADMARIQGGGEFLYPYREPPRRSVGAVRVADRHRSRIQVAQDADVYEDDDDDYTEPGYVQSDPNRSYAYHRGPVPKLYASPHSPRPMRVAEVIEG